MTLLSGQDPTDLPGGRSRSATAWGLNALGIVIVGFWFVKNGLELQLPVWVWVLGAVALAAWALREFGRTPQLLVVAGVVMIVAGSLTVVATDSLMIVPVIVGIVLLGANLRVPVWVAAVTAVGAVVVIAVCATIEHASIQFVLGTSGGLLLGVLIGFSRRQFRVAAQRARQAERDQQRAQLLADRSRASRDIHDVLAHSLGGLVLQLDAVEALLEAGRVDDATKRAGEARTLAADGLAEARRAVHALRDDADAETDATPDAEPDATPDAAAVPDPTTTADRATTPDRTTAPDQATRTTGADVPDASRASRPSTDPVPDRTDRTDRTDLTALVAAHRSFGGTIVVQGDATLAALDEAHRAAVVQVAREALSNARRHAPGRPVSLSVVRDGDAVDVVVANPLTGGGQGLLGMRERVEELGSGATVEAERSDDEFVVALHLPVDRVAEHEADAS
ncbi:MULTISPECIES: histidine kinase [unclassified Curtobacterium]|uniref:histidine kinase n=1 Tax=unclassified Curtobacterium TaxID=257496 RepID=UPI000F48DE60|nr:MULTISPECIES: histidine kinase [unclassified Curtobacterium]ROQ16336.1 histidine kinase [Curtobacterium sp. PhB171]ROQ25588.1 histidine kinase [Curtobacterium sp. PhB170]ROS37040.1 histidine kinase [Curtobacterium sp. PhB131]ROS71716.1 histidine kinase [Curtobacterium sp. PhB141]